MNDKQKQDLTNKVSIEIATICKFYNIDFYLLSKREIEMLVEIFQLGVGFIEKIKQEEVKKSIKTFNLENSFKNKPLQDDINNDNLKDE